jgi:hypothetical protein
MDGSSSQPAEVARAGKGDANNSERNNTSLEQEPQGNRKTTTDIFASTTLAHQAVTDSKQGNSAANSEQQE